jgi:hypothetical protein
VAASQTLVNVVFPRGVKVLWSGAQGEPIGEERYPADTTEVLRAPDGKEYPETQYLDRTWKRIGRRPHHVKHVTVAVGEVPDTGEAVVPLRVRIEADELPDEQAEYVIDHPVRVARRA